MDMLGTVQNVAMQSSHDRDGEQANSGSETGRGSRARVKQKKSERVLQPAESTNSVRRAVILKRR